MQTVGCLPGCFQVMCRYYVWYVQWYLIYMTFYLYGKNPLTWIPLHSDTQQKCHCLWLSSVHLDQTRPVQLL